MEETSPYTHGLACASGYISISPILRPSNITFQCGAGSVSINIETGAVTLTNCTIDEGAKAFWKAVEYLAPMKIAEY